ncbi:MAG TPA: hypothetical protein VFB68_11255 [Xanthobacteraceae bacterium]|nr:hypothetical protein [Xanthobacteraceae bacterium]
MSKDELNKYFEWFIKIIPHRIDELANAVRRSTPLGSWEPDLAPASLESLGSWFGAQIEQRPRTDEEVEQIKSRSAYAFDVSGQELTNQTLSLAMDVGMYLSQVLLESHPALRWMLPLDNKKFADYGQPVLIGFGAVPLNPVRIAVMLAYGIARGTQTGSRLRELHDYWSSRACP